MRANADEFAKPVTLEMGKLIGESHGEVALSADIIDYYAKNGERSSLRKNFSPVRAKRKLSALRSECCLACSHGIFPITSSRVLPLPISWRAMS